MHHTLTVPKGTRALPLLAAVLTVVLTLAGAPATALAVTERCGETSWTVDRSGTLTITAERKTKENGFDGRMGDAADCAKIGGSERANIKTVKVNEGVTTIGPGAFNGMAKLEKATLPKSLKSFDGTCFSGTAITSITIPSGVESAASPFDGASKLEEVVITSGMKDVPANLFNGSIPIKKATIPLTVESIGENAFNVSAPIKDVYYGGSYLDWNKLVQSKVLGGNDNLIYAIYATKVHYGEGPYQRLEGSNRYKTMQKIVQKSFGGQSDWAVIARGDNYPDALAASALAGIRNCPIIITKAGVLSDEAKAELKRLGVTKAYIMGGNSAVSEDVERVLKNVVGITNIIRISGANRVTTSVAAMVEARSNGTSDCVVIATGYNFADSLSISPWAYATKTPIILTNEDGLLSEEAVTAIKSNPKIKRVLIVGGPAVVSGDVANQLGSGYSVKRLAGNNRYETSREIALWSAENGLSSGGYAWCNPVIATGRDFADALVGAPLAARNNSVLLLVGSSQSATIGTLSENRINAYNEYIRKAFILGGTKAVDGATTNAVSKAMINDNVGRVI